LLTIRPLLALLNKSFQSIGSFLWWVMIFLQKMFNHSARTSTGWSFLLSIDDEILRQRVGKFLGHCN